MVASVAGLADVGAQTTELRGRVLSDSGVPVRGATITLTSIRYTVRSDSLGHFVLGGTPGSTLGLAIRAAGFRDDSATIVLGRGRPVVRDFVLVRESTPLPEPNPSDRVLRGRVTDTERIPLAYASIQINGGRRYVTDDSGRFTLPSPTGRFSLLVRRIGFGPEEVILDSVPHAALRIQLAAVAQSLPEQRVVGRAAFVSLDLSGFYRRMKDAERGINHGYFVTPEDFEFRKPVYLTQMADGFPTVRVKRGIPPFKDVITGALGCKMTVYLDRVRIVGKLLGVDDFVNELVPTNHVAGMEIYPRAVGAPPEYQPLNGTCGVVLIWTK